MNVLEKLKTMSDQQTQNWLRIIDPEDLKKAIPGINEEIRKCIYRNMSENTAKVLKDLAGTANKLNKNSAERAIKNLEITLKQA